jgi:hypothetical protein
MKPRLIIIIVLLAFVGASIVYVTASEIGSGAKARQAPSKPLNAAVPEAGSSNDKVVVYDFHGTARCSNCIKFEAYSQEAIRSAFSSPLGNGRLEWRVLNVDEPANRHFIEDYRLITRSVIVSKISDGKQVEWKNLQRIWELVGDKPAFVKYIQDEVSSYLGDSA